MLPSGTRQAGRRSGGEARVRALVLYYFAQPPSVLLDSGARELLETGEDFVGKLETRLILEGKHDDLKLGGWLIFLDYGTGGYDVALHVIVVGYRVALSHSRGWYSMCCAIVN